MIFDEVLYLEDVQRGRQRIFGLFGVLVFYCVSVLVCLCVSVLMY